MPRHLVVWTLTPLASIAMRVRVVGLDGTEVAIIVPPDASVRELRHRVAAAAGVSPLRCRLIHGVAELTPSAIRVDAILEDDAMLTIVITCSRYALTASGDSTAKLWDVENGVCVKSFEGHAYWVNSAVFSADGASVLTASGDNTANLWDVESGECVKSFDGHGEEVNSAVFSADGASVLTASVDSTARLWDLESSECVKTLEGHGADVRSAVFSVDGASVLTASFDRTAKLWDVESCECVKSFEGHGDWVNSAVFS